MVLYVVAPGKAYYAIRFSDIPPEYILGGRCFLCRRTGPIDRMRVQARWGEERFLRFVDNKLRCLGCGNWQENRFIVYGRRIREQAKEGADGAKVPAEALKSR
ncbi:hypothetical protein GGQ99_000996 [Aminobacter niigataensis]|uniref:Uncharacterized protein n=1 Tax=Aminobacter niigataensis TaxID=83265 RepID=A0ABR6KZC2_9HYPH|nr:hypothetical protein [Aminobacter niigataensis]MBB4649274.1 hypothetical protein [Aminobacter niigataensis]